MTCISQFFFSNEIEQLQTGCVHRIKVTHHVIASTKGPSTRPGLCNVQIAHNTIVLVRL